MSQTELIIATALGVIIIGLFIWLINANERARDARNARRWIEVNAILHALLLAELDAQQEFVGGYGAPILAHPVYGQIIVADASKIECDNSELRPDCPAAPTYTGPGKKCVANLSDLTPRYLPRLGVGPIGNGYMFFDTELPLDENNTGYYVHRSSDGKLTVGSCYTDRGAVIRLSR